MWYIQIRILVETSAILAVSVHNDSIVSWSELLFCFLSIEFITVKNIFLGNVLCTNATSSISLEEWKRAGHNLPYHYLGVHVKIPVRTVTLRLEIFSF